MAYLNEVFLMGNLTREPELRYTKSGTPICEFGLAMNKKTKTQSGEERSEVTFVEIVSIGKSAEILPRYLQKGSAVLVTGSLRYEQWKDRDGNNRNRLSVLADRVQFLDRAKPSEPRQETEPAQQPEHRYEQQDKQPSGIDDDIPF